MTTFDGTTAPPRHPADPDGSLADGLEASGSQVPDRDHPAPGDVAEPAVARDLFAVLAAKGEEAAKGTKLAGIYGFERMFLLMCRADIQEPEYKKYQRSAVPKNKRQSSNINPWEVEQRIMALNSLYSTARELWILTDTGYEMLEATTPNPLDCPRVQQALRMPTPYGVLEKMFGRSDGALIKASQRLQVAAGWLDASVLGDDDEGVDDDDDGLIDSGTDPTRARR